MSKIAVIGIAGESVFLSVEEFGVTGETVQAKGYHNELGGKGFNQAVAVNRYGVQVSFLCACYQGDVERFTKITESNGINPFFVGKQERSPYAVITTDKKGDNRVLVYRGAELDEKDVEFFANEIKTADILLINNEVPSFVNERAVKIAKENGVKVVLNPAPIRSYEKEFLEKIDLFTPNEHETNGLEDYQNVIVTLGEKGCFIRNENKLIPAEKVEIVVDTTGAGDTFNGVLAACIANGMDLRKACKKANLASGIKVTRKYILDSIPFKEEVEKIGEKNRE